jgi:choline dehydrogenase
MILPLISEQQDHLGVPLIFNAPQADTLYELQRNPWFATKQLLQYVFRSRGLFLFPNSEFFIFAQSKYLTEVSDTVLPDDTANNSHLPANIPDLEIVNVPYVAWDYRTLRKDEAAMSLFCLLLKPKSKGTVRLASLDPRERPICDLGFLSAPEDYIPMRKAVRLGIAMAQKMQKDGYPVSPMLHPEGISDEDLDRYIRKCARSTYHYSSTCRMAPEAEGGVVDDELRVHGIEGLRVADSSIFPTVLSTHLQAPSAMVGSRCAEFILKDRSVVA